MNVPPKKTLRIVPSRTPSIRPSESADVTSATSVNEPSSVILSRESGRPAELARGDLHERIPRNAEEVRADLKENAANVFFR